MARLKAPGPPVWIMIHSPSAQTNGSVTTRVRPNPFSVPERAR